MQKKILGKKGEDLVAMFLQKRGYVVLNTQWYCLHGELDIVAFHPKDPNHIVFVEVKTHMRCNPNYLASINQKKKRALFRSAMEFMNAYGKIHQSPMFLVVFCFLEPRLCVEYYYLELGVNYV